jgi:2-polyprenyl-3-methyl-5-hydroxy-6-metoxy-1,4-benzoquinol methylase
MDIHGATDPHQYDSPELDWRISGAEDRAFRVYSREQLDTVISPNALKGKRALDIGSGVGQLFNWLKNKGAVEIVGIDPSIRNVKTTKEKYPWVTSVQSTLHEFASKSSEKFNTAFAILVFEHIEDLGEAFRDIHSLLNDGGAFYLMIADKEYNLIRDKNIRGAKFVSFEIMRELDNGVIETKTIRDDGESGTTALYDLLRPIEQVYKAAQENGFEITHTQPVLGPYTVLPAERKYTICNLIVFKKINVD